MTASLSYAAIPSRLSPRGADGNFAETAARPGAGPTWVTFGPYRGPKSPTSSTSSRCVAVAVSRRGWCRFGDRCVDRALAAGVPIWGHRASPQARCGGTRSVTGPAAPSQLRRRSRSAAPPPPGRGSRPRAPRRAPRSRPRAALVGLAGGQVLEHQARPHQRPHPALAAVLAGPLDHLVGEAGDQRDAEDPRGQQPVPGRQADRGEDEDRQHHHDQQEAGPAARMQARVELRAGRDQPVLGLEGGDRLVLGAVVLEDPAQVGQAADRRRCSR